MLTGVGLLVFTQRMVQPAAQQPAAHRRAAAIQQREQRGRVFAGQGLRQFQVAARHRVQQHELAGPFGRQALHVGQRLRLRAGRVAQQRARRADARRHVFDVEAGQRVGLEVRQQMCARAIAFEMPVGYARPGAFEREIEFCAVGADDLGRGDAMQLGFQLRRRAFGHAEVAAGQVQPCQPGARGARVAGHEHRGQRTIGLGRQQRVVGQGAGCDDAHDAALDRAFGGRRIADLFADGDRFTCRYQSRQVLLHCVHRQPGHRDGRAVGRTPLGQRQVEQPRAALGVFIEHFIEVAHAVEQQQRTSLRLESEVLLHHGSVARVGVGGGVLCCGIHARDCIGPGRGMWRAVHGP